MKIAILHDYFDEIGGAEITLLQLARGINATIFTTNINKEKISGLGFGDIKIKSIGRVPNISNLKQAISIIKFYFLNLRNYDFYIFGGSYSIYAARQYRPNLWICFSPLRGLYDLKDVNSYIKQNFLIKKLKKLQTIADKMAVKKIEKILVPSLTVQNRIKKYYKRDGFLIYHPVETKKFFHKKHQDYWLSVSRIDYYKRIELQLNTFKKLPDERLIIIGEVSKNLKKYLDKLKNMAGENVSFAGAVYDRNKVIKLYSECKGFIATSKDEDFGLNVIEAMASGKPVIAPNEGGYKETVIDGKTGVLIDDINPDKLANAIIEIDKEIDKNPLKYRDACQKQAKKFNTKVFIEKIKKEIKKINIEK